MSGAPGGEVATYTIRSLVTNAKDWKWSSYRHYLTGEHCGVEIEGWKSR